MAWTRKRAAQSEGGFTIIELTVAMGLLAIVAASLAGVFFTAIRTAGVANHRTEGAAIASREIESMRAVTYSSVGFYGDQYQYAATHGTPPETTVTLAASTPADTTPPIQPVTPDPTAGPSNPQDPNPANATPIMQGNIAYSVQRFVTWSNAADATTTYSEAYKHLTVIVTWTDVVGSHSVQEDSLLYPGGQGKYYGPEGAGAPTSTTTTTMLLPPSAPVLDAPTVPADPVGEKQIDLTWSQPAGGGSVTGYVVQYSTDASFPVGGTQVLVNTLPPGTTSANMTGLAPATLYYFEVVANPGTPQQVTSNAVSATTLSQPVATCSYGPLTVTGATSLSTTLTNLTKNSKKMTENLTLGFSVSGTGCSNAYTVTGTVANPPVADQGSPWVLNQNGSTLTFSATILSQGQTKWSTGTHTFTVYDSGVATSVVKTFKVCLFGATTC